MNTYIYGVNVMREYVIVFSSFSPFLFHRKMSWKKLKKITTTTTTMGEK